MVTVPRLSVCLGIAMTLSTAAAGAAADAPPDLILHNARIVRVEPDGARAAALAVRGNRILAVGPDAEILALRGAATRVVDLGGRAVVPGLIDAHGHVASLGFALARVDLVGTRSAAEAVARVREAARTAPPGAWLRGRGWDQNDWEERAFPTAAMLDEAAGGRPIALGRIDGHALWANHRALELAGISAATPDPPGGRILRDAAGRPTGILVDNAMNLLESRIPRPDRRETREAIRRALDRCLDRGLTGVHDAGITAEEAGIYREMAAEGALPIRVYAMLGGTSRSLDDAFREPPASGLGGGFLSLRAVKLAVDGALGSRGAALLEDYTDEPGHRGLLTMAPEALESTAREAARRGWQVCIHAIGDRGNRIALDALQKALDGLPAADRRFRIEHAQILDPADIPRFRALGVIPSMQPTHCTSDMPWAADRLGPRRIEGAYAWRTLLDTGVPIPAGSDFPVESENPFPGLQAAVTRQDAAGNPPGGWQPRQRMTAGEALRAFTWSAAYAGFSEEETGSIGPGRRADILILAEDPTAVPPARLAAMTPEAVLIDGRLVRGKGPLAEAIAGGAPDPAGGRR